MMAIRRSSMSPLEHQQFQRLKVNRIAFIQELKVDHILNYLQSKSVVNDKDLIEIEKCRTTTEKSKRLLDILPTKGRASNWYKHFRAALLNPSVEDSSIKHKYQILVEFLDNTIIDQLSQPVRLKERASRDMMSTFPRYQPLPDIANNSSRPPTMAAAAARKPVNREPVVVGSVPLTDANASSETKQDNVTHRVPTAELDPAVNSQKWSMRNLKDTEIPHTIQYWDSDPENFQSALEIPLKEIVALEQSVHGADVVLGEQLRDAADRMKQLEIAYFLWRNQMMNDEMVFCTCSAVLDIIQDVGSHHLYLRYFEHLRTEYDMELVLEIAYSYDEVTQWLATSTDPSTRDCLVDIGLNILYFVTELGNFEVANQVVSSVEALLSNHMDTWLLHFTFYVRCMTLCNSSCDLSKSEKYHALASELRDRIGKAMSSFGKETLDCSELFMQTSILMRELGQFGQSYTWSQKAMQEVDLERKSIVVNVLCSASAAYANQWKVMRAEDLAVEAVQQAKVMFGVYHPIYLQALQNFVTFSNLFRHDSFGVEASITALNIANKLYGYNSPHVAHAYAGHCNALIAAENFGNMVYFRSAEKAYNTAVNCYTSSHPLTLPFLQTMVLALIHRVQQSKDEKEKEQLVLWTEDKTKEFIRISEQHFGDVSHATAKAHLVQGDVHMASGRLKDAEAYYIMASKTMSNGVGAKHGNVQRIRYKLATLAKELGEIAKAKAMLKDIVESFDTAAYYMSWYNDAYETLISCCELTESQELVKEYRSKHMGWKWISEDNRRKITWRQLHSSPEGYDSFLERFELWRSKVRKVQVHLEQLRNSVESPNEV